MLAAVVASTAIVMGSSRVLKGSRLSNPLGIAMINTLAVGSANASNVFVTRRKELIEGINVKNQNGKIEGKSVVAG